MGLKERFRKRVAALIYPFLLSLCSLSDTQTRASQRTVYLGLPLFLSASHPIFAAGSSDLFFSTVTCSHNHLFSGCRFYSFIDIIIRLNKVA